MKKSEIEKRFYIKQEYYHVTPNGAKCKVYLCNCLTTGCLNDIKIWSNSNRHDGFCQKCADTLSRRLPYTYLYTAFLNAQKHRNVQVELSFEEFTTLCNIKQCHYCDNPTIRDAHRQKIQSNAYMIDRKDNLLPYTKDNCVSCCWECNDLKSNKFSYEEFLKLRSFIKIEFGR